MVRVRIINSWTGREEYVLNVEIDRSSDSYLKQMCKTCKHLENYDHLLEITDNEYVLSLIKQQENCHIVIGW